VDRHLDDYREALGYFIARLQEYLPDKVVLNRVKALIGWVTKGLPGGAELRRRVYTSKSLPEALGLFEDYFQRSGVSAAVTRAGGDRVLGSVRYFCNCGVKRS
jgi:hypothetical protein